MTKKPTHSNRQQPNDVKLGGPAKFVPIFNPPIARSEPTAPNLKLRQRIQHGGTRGK